MELGQSGGTVLSLRVCVLRSDRTTLCQRSRLRASGNCRWSFLNFSPERKSRNEGKRRTLINLVRRGAPHPSPSKASPSREPRAYFAGLFFWRTAATVHACGTVQCGEVFPNILRATRRKNSLTPGTGAPMTSGGFVKPWELKLRAQALPEARDATNPARVAGPLVERDQPS